MKQLSWKKYTLNCYLVQYTFRCQIYSFSQPKKNCIEPCILVVSSSLIYMLSNNFTFDATGWKSNKEPKKFTQVFQDMPTRLLQNSKKVSDG